MQMPRLAIIVPLALVVTGLARAEEPAASPNPTLTVTFSGIVAKQGPIMMGVFDEAGWKSGTPLRGQMLNPTDGEARATIVDLPAGSYGIKAFHDINGNGKLDTNPLGIPTEPVAFSNNARVSGGPPKWADAVFALAPGTTAQAITIR